MSFAFIPPFVFLAAGLLCAILPHAKQRAILALVVPVISALIIWNFPTGIHNSMTFLGLEFVFMRVDKLSVIFGLIFSLAAFLSALYAWHVQDRLQQEKRMAE